MWRVWGRVAIAVMWVVGLAAAARAAQPQAELILHGGRVVTVDDDFAIREAIAVAGGRILRVGSNEEVLATRGEKSEVVDLAGKMVLPGLIDSHVHPTGASMHEFDHPIPEMESIDDVLRYIRGRAEALEDGEWIELRQVFITRLREQRYPTRAELDEAAPRNPVVFSTGPDAMLNTLALEASGIDRDFQVTGSGYIEKDPQTGEPTGLLRSCARYIKSRPSGKRASDEERLERLAALFADYNSVGLTSVADRSASDSGLDLYQALQAQGKLTVRVAASPRIETSAPLAEIQKNIRAVAAHPLRKSDGLVRIIGIKTFLDGGMLTGSAYMRQPWGTSAIYSITDASYRGVLFMTREELVPIVETAVEEGLQFTVHSVGDGAVHTLLEAYDEVARRRPIRATRPCITHSNFMSAEAVEKAAELGVVVDIQPAWLYLDTRTLVAQFGYDRLRYFQPLSSIFKAGGIAGGGSDHMQKIGSLRSVNPYNPFLGMWVTLTRKARWYDGALHPEEALTREQAIRFYTANNAYLLFAEDEIGSLEAGKRADLVVLDRDLLECPVDDIPGTQVLRTYLGGKRVYSKP